MKIINSAVFIIVLIAGCCTVASAQLGITSVEREVSAYLQDVDDPGQSSTLYEASLDEGLFSHDLVLTVGTAVISSSHNTMVSSGENQFSINGQMSAGFALTDPAFADIMESRNSMECYFTAQFFCDYSLSGIASGPCNVELQIVDVQSGQEVEYESVTSAEFDMVGQIPPGDYFVTVWMWDAVVEGGPVDRYSSVDFDLSVALEGTVPSEDICLGGIKALFR